MECRNVYKLDEEQMKLFEENINLARWAVSHKFSYINDYVSVDEKHQMLLIALTKACATFDPAKNCTFATYATRIMNNDCGMFLRGVNRNSKLGLVSLDADPGEDDEDGEFGSGIGNILADKSVDVENDVVNEMFMEELAEKLKARFEDARYIYIYEAMLDNKPQRVMAAELGMSQAWVSRNIRKVLNYIRQEYMKTIKNRR